MIMAQGHLNSPLETKRDTDTGIQEFDKWSYCHPKAMRKWQLCRHVRKMSLCLEKKVKLDPWITINKSGNQMN